MTWAFYFACNNARSSKMFTCLYRDQLADLFGARQRRRLNRGLKRRPLALMKRLRKAKKNAGPLEKPEVGLLLHALF